MFCQYCNRAAKTLVSNAQHELYCRSNPNAKIKVPSFGMLGKKGSNQYIKGTAKPLSDNTREKLSAASKRQCWSDARRANHSVVMKRVVEQHPLSYSSANRGRTKQIEFDGVKFQGNWELEFYKWALSANLTVSRCTTGFPYIWNGIRTYFPDFYIEDIDSYIEVKGYKTDRDTAKWDQFPKKLIIVDKDAIAQMRRGTFKLVDICNV